MAPVPVTVNARPLRVTSRMPRDLRYAVNRGVLDSSGDVLVENDSVFGRETVS